MRARTGVARLAQRNLNSVTAVPEKSPPLPKPDDRRVPDATWDDAEPLVRALTDLEEETGPSRLAQRNLNSVTAVPEKSPPLPKPDDRRVPDATWDDAEPLVRALTDLEEETGPSRLAQRNLNSVTAVPEKSPPLPKPDDRRVPDATWDDAIAAAPLIVRARRRDDEQKFRPGVVRVLGREPGAGQKPTYVVRGADRDAGGARRPFKPAPSRHPAPDLPGKTGKTKGRGRP